MVELRKVGEDAPLVQLSGVGHVSDVQEGGNVQLSFCQAEGNLTVPVKYFS